MIPQNKSLCIVLLLFFSIRASPQEAEFTESGSTIDSLREVYRQELIRKMNLLEYRMIQIVESQQVALDSLSDRTITLEREVTRLRATDSEMDVRLDETEQQSIMNRYMILKERDRFKRILLIAGPSLLALILISTILFFVLITRLAGQTDRKIMALRRYAYNEVDETRNELRKIFKKRIRKLQDRIVKGQGKKKKARAAKKQRDRGSK